MAMLHDPGITQPLVVPNAAPMDGDRHLGEASDPYMLTADDWSAIEEGGRDADAGRFVSDEEMSKLIPGW